MPIVNGTANSETLNGSAGADTINGFAGNDTITGGAGNDLARMGIGNDVFIWNPGDGDDVVRGQAGIDTLLVNGSGGLDSILIGINGTRAGVLRVFEGIVADIDDVERIRVRALGDSDGIFVDDLAGTDVKQVFVDLAGAVATTGDGVVDGVSREGTFGSDIINVALVNGTVRVTGLSAELIISHADANDELEIEGQAGNDVINASALAAGAMLLEVSGGNGNDRITGSKGDDELFGGSGNDVVAGGRGIDFVDLGTGNDVFAWSRGDGNDTVQGGGGTDTVRVIGANAGDDIDIIGTVGGEVRLNYSLTPTSVLLDGIERLHVRTLGGADSISVGSFVGTDLKQVTIDLAAKAGGILPDSSIDVVEFNGTGIDPDVVSVDWSNGKVLVNARSGGAATIEHAGTKDILSIMCGNGDDVVNAATLAAGKISLRLDGFFGDDVLFGSAGNDTAFGGGGNDVSFLGAGNDRVSGGTGNDAAYLGAGNDRYTWFLGDGNDTVDGGGGTDTFDYRDQSAGPVKSDFTIEAEAGRVSFSRIAGEAISLNGIERLLVMVGGGVDGIDVSDLAGTGMKLLAIDLAAPGTGAGDGVGDTVDVAGTVGNDLVTIGKFAGGVSVTGLPAQVTISHADSGPISDVLRVFGGDGNDTINASAMPDVMNTSYSGGNGNDNIRGGADAEEISGEDGNDTLRGGANFDFLDGGAGNDFLDGGTGKDFLDAGSGNDVLVGGRGNDELACGDGADRVRYTSVLDGHDIILDFDGDAAGGQDVLDLDALFDSLGVAASKRAGLVNITDLGNAVEVSVNADGKAGFELVIATLNTLDVITKGQDVIVGTL
jgi:Ca2+-binding RTX toxin-like protein